MEIIKNFGLDPILLGAQIINFLIIFFILKKFLYKPVLEIIKKREEAIKDGLKKAEDAQILLEKTALKEKEVLRNAQKEALKIIEDAKKHAQELIDQTEEKTRKNTQKMLNEAQLQIQQETRRVEKELSVNVSRLAVAFLQKTIKDLFERKEQKEIMDKALKRIKKAD